MTLRSIAIDVPSLLAKIYVPLQPLVRRAKLIRRGRRSYEPRDILLPSGYVAEVVCDGLTAPVHACFGPRGEMYVTESGHKSELPPRSSSGALPSHVATSADVPSTAAIPRSSRFGLTPRG